MIVSLGREVRYSYNKEKNALVIIFLNENDDCWNVTGWFGERLHELLENGGDLDDFLKEEPFGQDKELTKIFHRLVSTLMKNKIITLRGCDSVTSIDPFKKEEYLDFSKNPYAGSLVVKNLQEMMSEQFLVASAHNPCRTESTDNWCQDNRMHVETGNLCGGRTVRYTHGASC